MVQRKMNEGKKRKKRVVSCNSLDVQVVVPYVRGRLQHVHKFTIDMKQKQP